MSAAVREAVMNAETAVLSFVEPILGLGELSQFTLAPIDDNGVVFVLRSVDVPETRLFLLDPESFFPDYHPELADDVAARLGLDADGAVGAVLVVITPGTEDAQHTANLLAPVVFNAATGAAAQTVLDQDLPLRAPLVRA